MWGGAPHRPAPLNPAMDLDPQSEILVTPPYCVYYLFVDDLGGNKL